MTDFVMSVGPSYYLDENDLDEKYLMGKFKHNS